MFVPRYTVKKLYLFPKGINKTNWKAINETPLKKAGLLARKIERGLIRRDKSKKQNPSKPGRPPKSRHPRDFFREIFSLPGATDVIIGHRNLSGARQTPMEIHEFGQKALVRTLSPQKNRRRIIDAKNRAHVRKMYLAGKIKARQLVFAKKMIQYPKREFAYPTTVRVAKRLPPMWANSVTSGTVKN